MDMFGVFAKVLELIQSSFVRFFISVFISEFNFPSLEQNMELGFNFKINFLGFASIFTIKIGF